VQPGSYGSWSLPSEFGTPFLSGELTMSTAAAGKPARPTGRRSERVTLELGAGLRQRGGTGVSIQILDLSVDGFRASTHLNLAKGTDVWLRLPGLEPYQARVMWTKGVFVGCAFDRPLHPAVLDMVVGKAGRR
jgi:hypothetical protein